MTALLAAVALVFAAGWALGSIGGAAPGSAGRLAPGPALRNAVDTADPETAPMGLVSTRAGYTLHPVRTVLPWNQPTEVAFTLTGSDGVPVRAIDGGATAVDVAVIRRDDAGYEPLRATAGPDGVWRAPVTFPGAGVWRLYAGFTPTGGPALDLGADLFVPGPFGPFTFTTEQRTATSGPFQVRVDGELAPGGSSPVFATVSRDGRPVTDLEPVAGTGGAYGRLVAVRQGDLARIPLRAQVTGAAPAGRSGPGIGFVAELPSTGSYRLFLTFTQGGAERTAEFTVDAAAGS
ncbi:hypothetical protein EV378_2301 [Pseudonocardia endophytica]|uniref:Uncharacterized protein n=1 Tax=Pseudonocardia endophytica TaxID=401976 RepID=A0A4R1HUS4_PSEEN|nr:hypothetical protein EV378_2301 [Pseudonocardia endophytica]